MRNVLFVTYHDVKTEARSMELLECMKLLGKTTIVSYGKPHGDPSIVSISNHHDRRGYLEFLLNSIRAIRHLKPDLIVLHDHYSAPLLPIISKKRSRIIYDSSELRFLSEKVPVPNIRYRLARLLILFESKFIHRADMVIAANDERAELMHKEYKLDSFPVVFDNVHRIDTAYDEAACDQKFGYLFRDKAFYVLSAGGVAENRLTYKIVEDIGRLGKDYRLIILGRATSDAERKLKDLIKRKRIENVCFLGFVTREQLKYLMERSHVTVSAFAMDTLNNIYCASGKVFEGLFLGKPLLAGINPPLKRLCEQHRIGVSTDDYAKGVIQLKECYDQYLGNVQAYIKGIDFENRIKRLAREINHLISSASP